jgi:hypothetical protein
MKNFQGQIENPAVPELPIAGVVYSGQLVNQTNGSLRLFFVRLMSNLRALFGPAGSQFIDSPNGLFFSTADQTLAAINTGYSITFNETYLNNAISVASSSRITCTVGAVYNFQFSGQIKSTSSSAKQIYLWIKRDGTSIGYTTRQLTISGSDNHMPINWNFSIDVSKDSYIELVWASDSTSVTLETTTATSPHTGIPSAVLAVNFVAPLPVTLPTPP